MVRQGVEVFRRNHVVVLYFFGAFVLIRMWFAAFAKRDLKLISFCAFFMVRSLLRTHKHKSSASRTRFLKGLMLQSLSPNAPLDRTILIPVADPPSISESFNFDLLWVCAQWSGLSAMSVVAPCCLSRRKLCARGWILRH
jgi:hypothetical protein